MYGTRAESNTPASFDCRRKDEYKLARETLSHAVRFSTTITAGSMTQCLMLFETNVVSLRIPKPRQHSSNLPLATL